MCLTRARARAQINAHAFPWLYDFTAIVRRFLSLYIHVFIIAAIYRAIMEEERVRHATPAINAGISGRWILWALGAFRAISACARPEFSYYTFICATLFRPCFITTRVRARLTIFFVECCMPACAMETGDFRIALRILRLDIWSDDLIEFIIFPCAFKTQRYTHTSRCSTVWKTFIKSANCIKRSPDTQSHTRADYVCY